MYLKATGGHPEENQRRTHFAALKFKFHVVRLCKSIWQSEIIQTGLRHLVSSAKRKTLDVKEDAGRLFTNIKNNSGPRIRTALGNWAEIEKPIVTHCILDVR